MPGHSHLLPLPRVSFAQAALSPLPWHSFQPPAQKRHPHARPLHGAASRARLGWAYPHTGVLEKHLQPLPPWQEGQASAELCPPLSPEGADREVTGGAWPGAQHSKHTRHASHRPLAPQGGAPERPGILGPRTWTTETLGSKLSGDNFKHEESLWEPRPGTLAPTDQPRGPRGLCEEVPRESGVLALVTGRRERSG